MFVKFVRELSVRFMRRQSRWYECEGLNEADSVTGWLRLTPCSVDRKAALLRRLAEGQRPSMSTWLNLAEQSE
jgi:hypothetical protein